LSLCSVQADHKAEQSESDQVADIELGEPQQEESTAIAAAITTETRTSNDTKMEDAPSVTAVHGNGESSSTSNGGKRPSQQDTVDKDKALPPSKRTRTAPGGAQRRLFGVLTKTLSKFQEETKKDTESVSLVKCILPCKALCRDGERRGSAKCGSRRLIFIPYVLVS